MIVMGGRGDRESWALLEIPRSRSRSRAPQPHRRRLSDLPLFPTSPPSSERRMSSIDIGRASCSPCTSGSTSAPSSYSGVLLSALSSWDRSLSRKFPKSPIQLDDVSGSVEDLFSVEVRLRSVGEVSEFLLDFVLRLFSPDLLTFPFDEALLTSSMRLATNVSKEPERVSSGKRPGLVADPARDGGAEPLVAFRLVEEDPDPLGGEVGVRNSLVDDRCSEAGEERCEDCGSSKQSSSSSSSSSSSAPLRLIRWAQPGWNWSFETSFGFASIWSWVLSPTANSRAYSLF
mmetsp:Transcript_5461/g.16086  ORF Transcript_5461/g.16086 Transcript_5461/m.16086 type:complete len:288 (-) Transcript_5461:1093-1956(-)